MKESGEAVKRLIIVERLSFLAVLLFGLVSLTTSRMAPANLGNVVERAEVMGSLLAVAELDVLGRRMPDDVAVPIAGGKRAAKGEDEQKQAGDEQTHDENGQTLVEEEQARAEAERIEEERVRAEAERVEAEQRLAEEVQRQAEWERAARAQRLAEQKAAEQRAAEEAAQARAAQQKAAEAAAAQQKAAEAARKAQEIDYDKIVYTDDNGEYVDDAFGKDK